MIFEWFRGIQVSFARVCLRMGCSHCNEEHDDLPSGKHTKNYEKSPFLIGKSSISMAIFSSFLYVYRRVPMDLGATHFQTNDRWLIVG